MLQRRANDDCTLDTNHTKVNFYCGLCPAALPDVAATNGLPGRYTCAGRLGRDSLFESSEAGKKRSELSVCR